MTDPVDWADLAALAWYTRMQGHDDVAGTAAYVAATPGAYSECYAYAVGMREAEAKTDPEYVSRMCRAMTHWMPLPEPPP